MKKYLVRFIVGFIMGLTILVAGAATGLSVKHTAFPTADNSADFGIPAAVENANTIMQTNMLSKTVVNNNAANPYQVPSDTAYVIFTGTQPSPTMTISMPSATDSRDNQEVSVYTQASIASAVTFASSGGTVVGAPATMTTDGTVKFKYDSTTSTWYVVGH
jgi:hypothetical protein